MKRHTKSGPSRPSSNSDGLHQDTRLSSGEAMPEEDGAATEGYDTAAIQRAEELVDRFGERIGHYAGMVGRGLRAVTARAREQVQDIWAEADHVRKKGRS
jgi:hypothetical protein